MLRSFATFSIASRSSVASTVPSHMALWAWRYTSQDDSGDACGLGDCFAMPPSLASCAGNRRARNLRCGVHPLTATGAGATITVRAVALFRVFRPSRWQLGALLFAWGHPHASRAIPYRWPYAWIIARRRRCDRPRGRRRRRRRGIRHRFCSGGRCGGCRCRSDRPRICQRVPRGRKASRRVRVLLSVL
jgi:hypothetical protein